MNRSSVLIITVIYAITIITDVTSDSISTQKIYRPDHVHRKLYMLAAITGK
jgi:hypothetical protein